MLSDVLANDDVCADGVILYSGGNCVIIRSRETCGSPVFLDRPRVLDV